MSLKDRPVEKLYYTIGEVAAELGVNTSLIRYWEKEIGRFKPKRTNRGDRVFDRKDIDQLKRIHHLVKEKGFTLSGAREQLRSKEVADVIEAEPLDEIKTRLKAIRAQLLAMGSGKDPQLSADLKTDQQ